MRKCKLFIFFLIALGLVFCKNKSEAADPSPTQYIPAAQAVDFSSEIAFYNFRFSKEKEAVSVSLVDAFFSEGELKKKNEYAKTGETKVLIQFRNIKNQPLLDCFIPDPFEEHLDLFSENGKIEKVAVELAEKVVSLRIQVPSQTPKICHVYSIDTLNTYHHLTTLKLEK